MEGRAVLVVGLRLICLSVSEFCFPVESHLQTQRAAVKMLHDRILVLVDYVKAVLSGMGHYPACVVCLILLAGSAPKDHATIRSLAALVASLPASDSQGFREEFETVCIRTSTHFTVNHSWTGIRRCSAHSVPFHLD